MLGRNTRLLGIFIRTLCCEMCVCRPQACVKVPIRCCRCSVAYLGVRRGMAGELAAAWEPYLIASIEC